jgi:YfiH family protein
MRTQNLMPGRSKGATAPVTPINPRLISAWQARPLWHGFLGREGGVSRGEFASLNFSYQTGDDAAAVGANWQRLRARFAADTEIALVRQVHGTQVHRVSRDTAGERLAGDGMVTDARNLVLGIMTADCVPILLVEQAAGVIGALHAGWRGVLGNIAQQGIAKMADLGARAERIQAALGPAIGWCCFEVDADLAERFAAADSATLSHVREGAPGKAFLNLRGIIRDQLLRAGLDAAHVFEVADCTRCAKESYFSRRGAGGVVTGLQLSYVGLQP